MKRFVVSVAIFFVVFIIYFAVGTQYTFKPKWAIDHFNPMASSLLKGQFNIESPAETHDLIYFSGKWYMPWGILPALFLIPPQMILGRFIPIFYMSVFFAGLNVSLFYLLLERIKKEFLPEFSYKSIFFVTILFAFGTTHFYVGTLGSTWHVSQMVASFFATLGIFAIFKKKRSFSNYFFSSVFFSITLLCRPSTAFLLTLPLLLFLFDFLKRKKMNAQELSKGIILICLPFVLCLLWYFFYNYIRFGNILQTGYDYIKESPNLETIREANGVNSIKNIPQNFWYMFFEVPRITFSQHTFHFDFNLYGNSILFLTPPFLTAFLAFPFKKEGGKLKLNFYILSLWVTSIIALLPILMHYSSGWMQFGYRYTLDVTVLLLLLSIFGIKGKVNVLYVGGILLALIFHIIGIQALM